MMYLVQVSAVTFHYLMPLICRQVWCLLWHVNGKKKKMDNTLSMHAQLKLITRVLCTYAVISAVIVKFPCMAQDRNYWNPSVSLSWSLPLFGHVPLLVWNLPFIGERSNILLIMSPEILLNWLTTMNLTIKLQHNCCTAILHNCLHISFIYRQSPSFSDLNSLIHKGNHWQVWDIPANSLPECMHDRNLGARPISLSLLATPLGTRLMK